ncbi:MAG: YlxM family DNA-binding protein [Bacillota bacterium]|nr:YlxM family DNA-binding protein [Bacillota bacterium]
MDEYGRKALLFDVYGPLLTQRQQEIYDLAHSEDLSLGEIAEDLSVSRQAVHDTLRRTDAILEEYEKKLGLAAKFMEISARVDSMRQSLAELAAGGDKDRIIADLTSEINAIDAIERR